MKVLLVATNREQSPYPVAPLGALCVAAAAKAAGHEIKFLDLGLASAPPSALQQALEADEFQAVAFGIRNLDNCWAFAPRSYFNDVQELAGVVRRHFKGPLILGGSGFSVSPNGWMQRLEADYGVIGEGERTLPELLARLEAGRAPEGIGPVVTACKKNDSPAVLPARSVERLVELPLPAHDLCRYPGYVKRGGFVSVQTKRGCPFKCSYCIYPQLEGKRYRLRPPESVAEEVEKVATQSKMRDFFFVDSVFNDPRKHALAMCTELSRRKLPIRWNAFCNPVGFDAELARAMAQAGCIGVEFGLDVATPKMLKALDKPFCQEEIRIALQAARDAHLPFAICLLFGGPGETWADVEETQAFLNGCAPANAVFATYGLRVYEGTPLAKTAVTDGQLSPDHDLFEPAYYLSTGMAENTDTNLDRIARRRAEWSSPADWRRPVT
ncbi:MAG TPA: radical SAM protein, partial [Verrucomicrobiae bacterium]